MYKTEDEGCLNGKGSKGKTGFAWGGTSAFYCWEQSATAAFIRWPEYFPISLSLSGIN